MKLTTVTAGAAALSVDATLKRFLRISGTADDTLLGVLIAAVQDKAEAYAGRSFTERTLRLSLDTERPRAGISSEYGRLSAEERYLTNRTGFRVRLLMGPARTVSSVKVVAEDGTETTLDAGAYYLSGDEVVFTGALPATPRDRGGLVITYTAGYGTGEGGDGAEGEPLPDSVTAGLYMALKTIYENREDFVVGTTLVRLPGDSLSFFDAVREVTC